MAATGLEQEPSSVGLSKLCSACRKMFNSLARDHNAENVYSAYYSYHVKLSENIDCDLCSTVFSRFSMKDIKLSESIDCELCSTDLSQFSMKDIKLSENIDCEPCSTDSIQFSLDDIFFHHSCGMADIDVGLFDGGGDFYKLSFSCRLMGQWSNFELLLVRGVYKPSNINLYR